MNPPKSSYTHGTFHVYQTRNVGLDDDGNEEEQEGEERPSKKPRHAEPPDRRLHTVTLPSLSSEEKKTLTGQVVGREKTKLESELVLIDARQEKAALEAAVFKPRTRDESEVQALWWQPPEPFRLLLHIGERRAETPVHSRARTEVTTRRQWLPPAAVREAAGERATPSGPDRAAIAPEGGAHESPMSELSPEEPQRAKRTASAAPPPSLLAALPELPAVLAPIEPLVLTSPTGVASTAARAKEARRLASPGRRSSSRARSAKAHRRRSSSWQQPIWAAPRQPLSSEQMNELSILVAGGPAAQQAHGAGHRARPRPQSRSGKQSRVLLKASGSRSRSSHSSGGYSASRQRHSKPRFCSKSSGTLPGGDVALPSPSFLWLLRLRRR
ncbi:hypothetical protein Efla_002880 [Eimeria flavescens]